MAMMLGNMLFEIFDMLWVGRVSAAGIAAVSVASYMVWTIKSLTLITAGGTNAQLSQNAGAKNWDRVAYWFWRGTLLSIVYSILIAAVSFIILRGMLEFMGLERDVLVLAMGYLKIFCASLPAVFLFAFFMHVFRAIGDTLTSAVITAFSLALNIVLDPILIFGWLGAPEMGVPGASLASAISQCVGVVLFIWRLKRTNLPLGFRSPREEMMADFAEISRIGVPLALSGAMFSVIYIFITKIVAQFGTIQIAAMGVGQRLEGLVSFACMAVAMALATLVGQNVGAGNIDRAKAAVSLATKYLVIFTLGISAIFIFAGNILASILTPDQAVIGATARYLIIIGLFEAGMALEMGLQGAFTGSGDTLPPFLISGPLTLVRIPVAWFLALRMGFGVNAVWWTISVSKLLKGILIWAMCRRGKWLLKRVKV
jgi:putative MATE family efflux protein